MTIDELVDGNDQGSHFRRYAHRTQGLLRIDAALADFGRQPLQTAHRAADRPTQNGPDQRDGEQQRKRGACRRVQRDLVPGAPRLRDLDIVLRVAPAIDAPILPVGDLVGQSRH